MAACDKCCFDYFQVIAEVEEDSDTEVFEVAETE